MKEMETALLKSLNLLRETAGSLTEKEIAWEVKEDVVYVSKVLKKLREREVIIKNGEFYSYWKTPANENFSERMLAVYDKINRKSEVESLITGLLALATQYKYLLRQNTLLRVLTEEGFDPEHINNFLQTKARGGEIKKLKVIIRKEKEVFFPLPPIVPWYYTSHLLQMDQDEYERLTKRWTDEGFVVQEEDYLTANFPSEVTHPAKEYLEREMPQIRRKLRDESFEWWYGLRLGWRY